MSTFHWVDGSRITYSFWEAGEPNNFEDKEDKVEIQWYNDVQFGTKGPGQWNDIGKNFINVRKYNKLKDTKK